jgi:hypothetical protein
LIYSKSERGEKEQSIQLDVAYILIDLDRRSHNIWQDGDPF